MKFKLLTMAVGAVLAQSAMASEKMPSQEEMWHLIKMQQKQIESLQAQMETTDKKAEAVIEAVEEVTNASGTSSLASRTHIGGYGELHYNNLNGSGGASDKKEADFHRFVLFFGHEFTDSLRFFSELEVEHAISGEGKQGEVELEQAYIELDLNDRHSAKAGVFLLPVGLINETHEPPAFYGVERNSVEKDIIPATWWAAGLGLNGEITEGWHYDIAVHEGLNTSASAAYKPRSGRQKSGKAKAEDLAFTGRLKWTGMEGLEAAMSWQHQTDITQGNDANAGNANLYEAHIAYNNGPFAIKALAARWDLDGSGPKSIGADRQQGWYVEPSFKLSESLGVFTRYSMWDNAAGNSSDSEKVQWDLGVNYWLDESVVVKADYQYQDNENDKNQKGFNLGLGYQF